MWLCMKRRGAWLYGVHRTRRDGSSFMRRQPCLRCKYTTSVDIQKRAIKKLFTHVESYVSAVSLLESGEQRYIKAINNNNKEGEICSNNNQYRLYRHEETSCSDNNQYRQYCQEGKDILTITNTKYTAKMGKAILTIINTDYTAKRRQAVLTITNTDLLRGQVLS